jgi:hypothetical protein
MNGDEKFKKGLKNKFPAALSFGFVVPISGCGDSALGCVQAHHACSLKTWRPTM